MKKLVIILLTLFALQSCNQNVDPLIENGNTSVLPNRFESLTPTIENGYLKFPNADDLSTLFDLDPSARAKTIEGLEGNNDFVSHRRSRLVDNSLGLSKSLKLRKAINSQNANILPNRGENWLPPFIESIVNEKGLVRFGNVLYQFSYPYVKRFNNFSGSESEINRLLNCEESDIKSDIEFTEMAIKNLVTNPSIPNARFAPFTESVQGTPLPIPYYGTFYVRGFLLSLFFDFDNDGVGLTMVSATSVCVTSSDFEVVNIETEILIFSTTHPNQTGSTGVTPHTQVIASSSNSTPMNFQGKVVYAIYLYLGNLRVLSAGEINITN